MATIAEIMSRDLVTVEPGISLQEAARQMDERHVGAALVLEGDALRGIVTERDVLRAVAAGPIEGVFVADWMTHQPETIDAAETTRLAASLMIHGRGRAWHVGGAAAAIAIVAPNPPDDRWAGLLQYDLGHATKLMMLAAADLGIGTCHSSVQDQELARKILAFPDDRFLAYLVSLGYPADGPLRPLERLNRRPFDEVVHHGSW